MIRVCPLFLVALGVLGLGGCGSTANVRYFDAALVRGYLRRRGVETGEGRVEGWADPRGRTVYVAGSRKNESGELAPCLVLIQADRPEPRIVDVRGVDMSKRWVDTEGRVWDLPSWSAGAQIDRASGLFLKCEPPTFRSYSVGRMDHPEGWLFSGELPEGAHGAHVKAKGEKVIVCEDWNFKVHGVPSARAHFWVLSPDAKNPGAYVQTDSYWQEEWAVVPEDEVRLRVEGEWFGERLKEK